LVSVTVATLIACSAPTHAQEPIEIDADRPHVGTGTHVVPRGEVQFELGGHYQHFGRLWTYGSPVLMRIGVSDRVEARFSSDGFVGLSDQTRTARSAGNIQAGAKVRLFGDREEPWLSILPVVNFGVADREEGLGTGGNDVTLTLLAGAALSERAHVEANLGIGNLGASNGARFAQQLVTGAVTHQTTRMLTTYVECAWWSGLDAGGDRVSFVDYGVIYALTPRMLVDGGAFTGLTDATADYGLFAGLSFVIGHRRPPTRHRFIESLTGR
jgi:hypothetical protein